jgi:hypothetical protein
MNSPSAAEIIEALTKSQTKEWNEALSSRLESVRSFLDQDQWAKGVAIYLRAVQAEAMRKLIGENLPDAGVHYVRGLIAGLQIVLSLPTTIEGQISMKATAQNRAPKGDAGY